MKRLSIVLSIGLIAVIAVSLYAQRAHAEDLQPQSAATFAELSQASSSTALPLDKIVYSSGYTTANRPTTST